MRCADPARLTASERFAEIADIVARGYVRLVARQDKPPIVEPSFEDCLDAVGQAEASCHPPSSNPKRRTSKT